MDAPASLPRQEPTRIRACRAAVGKAACWLVLFAVFMASGFCTVSFLAAKSAADAAKSGEPLPPGWSAGVMNHGKYYQWWLIRDRPIAFAACAAAWAGCFALAWRRDRTRRKNRMAG